MNRMVFPKQQFCNAFSDLATDMEQLMGHMFTEVPRQGEANRYVPRLDISELEASFEVVVDLPGVKTEDVNVELDDDELTISGERKTLTDETDGKLHRTERFSGEFLRRVTLPATVDREKIEASIDNGVLRVVLPKSETVMPKKIEVKAS